MRITCVIPAFVATLVVSLLSVGRPAWAAGPTPGPDLSAIQLQIGLRTTDGAPVPGIHVTLAPVASGLGGPTTGPAPQIGTTDAAGQATFTDLGSAIWQATFTGSYKGRALKPAAEQGQAPYGTTRGGGFVVQVETQEENEDRTSTNGATTPPLEQLGFVLLPVDGSWVPALDLAAPDAPPEALPTGVRQFTPRATTDTVEADPAPHGLDPFYAGLWLLPLAVAGVALVRVWRQRGAATVSTRDLSTAKRSTGDGHDLAD